MTNALFHRERRQCCLGKTVIKMSESLAMKRILKVEKKKRVDTHVMIEKELLNILRREGFNISNIVNIALEEHLRRKGLLK